MYNNPSFGSLISYCFILAFTSEDINFLQLHSKLSEKKIFVTHFPFFYGFNEKNFCNNKYDWKVKTHGLV